MLIGVFLLYHKLAGGHNAAMGVFLMKSYVLAITITMFLSALYAFQNPGSITVRFLIFERTLPQGVWDVVVFCVGAAIMWMFSVFSSLETVGKYKRMLKEKDAKISALENEKKMILESVTINKPAAYMQSQDTEEPAAGKTGTAD